MTRVSCGPTMARDAIANNAMRRSHRHDGERPVVFRLALFLIGVAGAVIAGCGGGGGSKPAPTATPTSVVSPTPVPTQPAGAGVESEIISAAISSSGQISVTFLLTDGSGVPLKPSLTATQDPQQARVRLTIAHLEQYEGGGDLGNTFYRYVNGINETAPAYDRNGTIDVVDGRAGVYRYTFRTMLPAGYDPSLTHSVGMQVDRTFDGVQESANPVHDFVPAGGTPFLWQDTTTAECNTCHNPLIAHGNRREVRLCQLCHTEAATDPKGTTIQFRTMIHKIHAGKDLPSVVGGPPGAFYGIFSGFSMSYDIFSEKLADGQVVGVGFPRALEDCAKCHTDGPTASFYAEKPSTAACATCHDDVNPSQQTTAAGPPGTNHSPGGYADGQCSACHAATQNQEFDISVPGSHVIPARSRQLAGLNVSISDISSHGAGERPTFTFSVTNNAGTPLRDLSTLGNLTFNFAGPTTDYTTLRSGSPLGSMPSGALVGPDAEGAFQFTPNAAIPADATGTWSVGVEARRNVPLTSSITATEAAVNPVVTFTVDDSPALPRRTVVDIEKCGDCHGEFSKDFSIHGALRNQTEYCVLCHNSTQSDVARRRRDPVAVAAGELTAPIDFKVLIHKIHRGEALEQQPYVVYGFGPPPVGYTKFDFGEVRFPGNLRDCETCHVDESQLIPPFPDTALPTLRTRLDPATGNPVPADPPQVAPITSACTACHDSDEAMAHAETQTAPDGVEACAVCHAEGRLAPVSAAHAVGN